MRFEQQKSPEELKKFWNADSMFSKDACCLNLSQSTLHDKLVTLAVIVTLHTSLTSLKIGVLEGMKFKRQKLSQNGQLREKFLTSH